MPEVTSNPPRRRLRAAERRPLILAAALAEFAEHGYEAASMGRIGHAAGVSRTVLYDHFDSKRALFAALLKSEHAVLLAQMRAALADGAPMAERLRAMIDAFFTFAEGRPLSWRLLFPEHAPVDRDVAADHRRQQSESNRLLAAMLRPDAARAGVDPASPGGQAMFAMQQAALHRAVHWWHAHPSVSREELVDAAMDALFVGLGGLEQGRRVSARAR